MYKKYDLLAVLINILMTTSSVITGSQQPESAWLKNIRQVTFPSMGFEKAGESYFSPDGQTLIFQAVPIGQKNYQIYTINLNSGLPKLVSTGLGNCTCAFFRPDGAKIIFASSHSDPSNPSNAQANVTQAPGYKRDNQNYAWEFTPYMNIYEANPDGSDLVALTSGPGYSAECAYSSDGSQIVFASNRSGQMQLYTMHCDGSNLQQITNTEQGYNGGPFFSPDGTKIIYRADYAKKDYLQIYCIDIATKQSQQVLQNEAINWAPFWHPQGNVIVFTTSLHGHAQYELYLLNIKTNCLQRLTNHAGFDGLASFNKDGTKITWTSKRGIDRTCQIFVADFVPAASFV